MKIANRAIGADSPPFIIAEMSGNHNQDLDRALQIVEAAARAGAHALKLQTYTADTMTLDVPDGDFFISDPRSPWQGHSLYELYQKAYTPWEWHQPLFERARELGMLAFSTPFDASAVDFLERLEVPCYKIASFESIDLALIRKAAATRKPLIISTGMATVAEIEEAVHAARSAGCRDLLLLKCTSSYPAPASASNLVTIPHLRQMFGCPVGLSDHTLGIGVALASVALGAVAIEKHVTLKRSDGGVDSDFSLEPEELRQLVEESQRVHEALGGVTYGASEDERASLVFRRSLYVARDMREGEVFTAENLRVVRPGMGLAPKYYDVVLGRRATRALRKGTRVTWDVVS